MNERIRELAEEATTIEVIRGRGFDETQYIKRFDKEKFAESIVHRCVEVINAGKIGYNQVPAEVALDLVAKNVKAYFGVK